jgi:hypothetical protein
MGLSLPVLGWHITTLPFIHVFRGSIGQPAKADVVLFIPELHLDGIAAKSVSSKMSAI